MFTALYAALSALLICRLAIQVIKARRKHQVRYADGGVEAVQIARSAHSNCIEYIPVFLILLFLLEYNGGHALLINLTGCIMLAGRILHARGILKGQHKYRVLGMQITFATLVTLAALNIIWLGINLTG